MIKRPSRKLISSSLRSDLPMCVNTFDYNSSSTDPGEPLPSSVNITVNAPAKLSYPSLGTSGFTSSSNSYGVTTVYPFRPFTVTNPVRMQFKATGQLYWSASSASASSSSRVQEPSIDSVSVTRSSNSSSTVFDTAASAFVELDLCKKFIDSGYYLRAGSPYLFAVYGEAKVVGGSTTTNVLAFVYSPLKLLPRVFDLRMLEFVSRNRYTWPEQSTPGNSTASKNLYSLVEEDSFTVTCTTSPVVIDTENIVEEVFSTYNGFYAIGLGVTALSFTL